MRLKNMQKIITASLYPSNKLNIPEMKGILLYDRGNERCCE